MSKIISSFSGRELKKLGQVDLKGKSVNHEDLRAIGFDCQAFDNIIIVTGKQIGRAHV